jgi:putative membrane protein
MHGRWIQEPGMYGHAAFFGPLFLLLIVALLVLGAIFITRTIINRPPTSSGPGPAPSRGPLAILEERFARGEIDEDEFTRRREVLRS